MPREHVDGLARVVVQVHAHVTVLRDASGKVLLKLEACGVCHSDLSVQNGTIPMPPPPNSNAGYTAHILVSPGLLLEAFAVGATATLLSGIVPAMRRKKSRFRYGDDRCAR